jgi:hypothetical protein
MIPLDALSLAANVVQFVSFGVDLLSKANEIRKDGALKEFVDLSTINRDLTTVTEKLRVDLPHGVLSEEEQALCDICTGCLEVSKQLQSGLAKLEIGPNAGKWKSVRKAFKVIWEKGKLTELKMRLEEYSNQLDRRVLVALRYASSGPMNALFF